MCSKLNIRFKSKRVQHDHRNKCIKNINKSYHVNVNVNLMEKKCNSDQWWNNDRCQYGCKKHNICEKYYIWNLPTCSCENGKYLASIMDNSAIMCDEVIESYDENAEAKSYNETNLNKKKATCKTQNF